MGAERECQRGTDSHRMGYCERYPSLVGATKVHHVLDAACASDIQLRDEEIILLEQLAAETEWIHEAHGKNRWCKARPEQTV